ncbi:MAG: response regulator [Bacteroides sp.]|nr:response regulator [Bacteroides sp.]
MRSILTLIALVCIIIFPITSQGNEFHTFHLDHTCGLSNNFVRGISQDKHGFVWVATIDGLNRFDGTHFESFKKENSGLESNEINHIISDPHNPDIVWVSSRNDGLFKYDYATGLISKCSDSLRSNDIPNLSLSSDNNIWITYYSFPPEKYNPSTGQITRLYDIVPENFKGHAWCTLEDDNGQYLYIGHDGRGLTQVNLKSKQFTNFQPQSSEENTIIGKHVYSIHIDRNGEVWCGTENGISIFSPYDNSFRNITHSENSSLPSGAVKCIREISDSDIWVGTDKGGLCKLSANKCLTRDYHFETVGPDRSAIKRRPLISSFVSAIFEDSFGNIWIGNRSDGVDVVSYEAPFFTQTHPFPSGDIFRKSQAVWSLTTDKEENLWIGGENLLIRKEKYDNTYFSLPTNPGDNAVVCAIHCDKDGILWIGTFNSGVWTFNPRNNQFTPVEINAKEIRCFAETPEKTMLIGTHEGLFRSSDKKHAVAYEGLNQLLLDKYIISMAYDATGNLWVGTYGHGVAIVNRNMKVNFLKHGEILPSNTINHIFEDSKGNMWLATRNGAVRVSKQNYSDFTLFDNNDGLLNNDVKGITEDSAGNIWISTNKGIALLNMADQSLTTYSYSYGKPLFSYCEGSVCTDSENRIFFGSLDGLTHFKPSLINIKKPDRKIILSEMIANDRNATDPTQRISIPINSENIEIPYNLNTFTLLFCNPDITQAANSEYVYNMKGVNEVWTPVHNINEAVYRSLHPGNYEFRVCHRLNGEQWSEPVTLASIKIIPPIYLRWWAKILYVLATVILILLIIYFYKHKIDLEKNLAIERENSKNNQLLNEERMIFFTNITHELRTPLSLIIGPIEDLVNDKDLKAEHRKKLLTIRTSSIRLLNLINGILEFRKTETQNKQLEVVSGNFANFIREIGIRFKELNTNNDLSIIIDVADMEGNEMFYDPEVITIILNNLLGNAIKYTKSGSVTLSLQFVTEGQVRFADMSVSDTGEGIDKDILPHIFERYYQAKHNRKVSGTGIGLALTKSLVELHEATISVKSEVGKGSTFTVRLIAANSYPNAIHKEIKDSDEQKSSNATKDNPNDDEKLTLLAVEDDDDVRNYIAQALSDDFKVYCASNGKEGLEIAMKVIPDIIVSDIMMPVMDGIELLTKIKSETAISHIPVILLTAKDSILDKEEGYASGADSYITKPFSANLLRTRINNIIEGRHKLTMRMLDVSPAAENDEEAPQNNPADDTKQNEIELTSFDREFITKFKKLTIENIEQEELDIAFFTDKMCMSHSTLYRKVKSITGLTPNEFIRTIKLHEAAEMLMSGKVALSDIPFRTGFNSAAYFRRVFKKEFGMSPTDYVNQNKTTT